MARKRTLSLIFAALLFISAFFASCGIKKEKGAVAPQSTTACSSTDNTETESSKTEFRKKVGELFQRYYEIIKSGEYTLKITANQAVGGESVPKVTTSVFHDGKINITVEESYDNRTSYLVEDGKLHFLSEDAETRPPVEFDPAPFEISLFSEEVMLVGEGSMELFGKSYQLERYVDKSGDEFGFLFDNGVLERKLVYKNSLDEYSVKTVSVMQG